MANYCSFELKAVGSKRDVEEFVEIVATTYDYSSKNLVKNRHLSRILDYDIREITPREDGSYSVFVSGYCAWSVQKCMTEQGYYNAYKNDYKEKSKATTLKIESERLNLSIEVFSKEPDIGFEEHYLYENGREIIDHWVDTDKERLDWEFTI